MNELFILGAGASTDFESSHRTLDLTRPPVISRVSDPLPVADNFFTIAIEKDVLKETYYPGLWSFIQTKYGESFNSLKNGSRLNVEQVYMDLDNEERKIRDWTDEKVKLYLTKLNLIRMIESLLNKFIYHNWICLNHKKLADYCSRTKSNIVSFNWDTLIDDALFVTEDWHYENGYGVDFFRMYRDGNECDGQNPDSCCLLLKPHGSINWFRYRDFYSSNEDGFTGEVVTERERRSTGLFLFSLERRNESECRSLRLDLGKGYNQLLKMAVEIDIVPPGEYMRQSRPQYQKIGVMMRKLVSEADKITIIGFALKDTDSDSKSIFKEGRQNSKGKSITIEIVNRSKGDTREEKRLEEACIEVFAPCKVQFSPYSTFRAYCEYVLR